MSGEERRQSPRINCKFNAELYILFPEETFRPHPYMVTVTDASLTGMRVSCRNLTEEQFSMLLDTVRFARVVVRHEGETARLYCRIVWLASKTESEGRKVYELGMAYDIREKDSPRDAQIILEKAAAHRAEEA